MTKTPKQRLSASLEDYLETISHIMAEKKAVRAKDIALRMKVKRPSVTGALQALSKKGFVNYAPYDVITLTSKGRSVANRIVRRHEVLQEFFVKILAVDEGKAEKAACRMEHALSDVILKRLMRFIEFLEICPRGRDKWVERFKEYYESGEKDEMCEMCHYSEAYPRKERH